MMKKLHPCVAALVLLSAPGVLPAQDYDYHPYISDSFTISLGAMRSSNSFKVGAFGSEGDGEDIDFDESVGVDDSSTFFNGQFRWKFGSEKKWSLAGQYFSSDAVGNATLTEDVEWEGVTFERGTYVEAGVKFEVARLFFGRSFIRNDQHDFGVGLGVHNLDLSAYIEGEVRANGETTGVQKLAVGASQPLPNIGGWYNFSPARNWLLHARVDWISANAGDYDGTLWNGSFGVNYQAWRNVGFDLYWQYFNLDVGVEKSDWIGGASLIYSGPVLGMTINW